MVLIATLVYSKITFSAEPVKQAPPRSYLELPTSGKLSAIPYVWERKTNRKYLVAIGSRHERNPRSPMFDRIDAIFKRVRPEMVIYESVAPKQLKTMPRDQSIVIAADLGLTIYLAGKYGAPISRRDPPERAEFKALLADYPA